MRLAATADLHCPKISPDYLGKLFTVASQEADVLILGGDLTDRGVEDEARVLAKTLSASAKIPVVAVLGNHDYESGKAQDIKTILTDAGVQVLDGDAVDIQGVGFAGAKGFAGGCGARPPQPCGDEAIN